VTNPTSGVDLVAGSQAVVESFEFGPTVKAPFSGHNELGVGQLCGLLQRSLFGQGVVTRMVRDEPTGGRGFASALRLEQGLG